MVRRQRGTRRGRSRRRGSNRSTAYYVPITTLAENIFQRVNTSSGATIDVYPTSAGSSSTSDIIVRPTSIDIQVMSSQPTPDATTPSHPSTIVLSVYVNNAAQWSSRTVVMSWGLPNRIKIKVPRTVDYGTATSVYFRISVNGPSVIAGIAFFSVKHVFDSASIQGEHITNYPADCSGASSPLIIG